MTALLSLDDALAVIARVVAPVAEVTSAPLAAALGATTAQAITAPRSLPPFTNTGVDGYAFRHAAGETTFTLAGTSFAGEPFAGGTLAAGMAARIATGAVLPAGADTVVMQEYCHVEGGRLVIDSLPPRGANIRAAGADIAMGADVLPAGHRLRPQDIALLGALGLTEIAVRRSLRIAIASTGAELAAPGATLAPGQIVDTNGLMLKHLLAGGDARVTLLPALPDDAAATRDALQAAAAADHDLIITTGGVSVGERDFVQAVLRAHGTVHFWKLAIRPGKPVLFGSIDSTLVMGLPGNPVSALVTFLLLVTPLLATLRGGNATLPPAYPLPLAAPLAKDAPLRSFPRARLVQREGQTLVLPYHDQSSNLFTSLTTSDGLLDLPAPAGSYHAGDSVMFRPFSGLL